MKKTIKRNNIKVPAYTKGSTGTGDSTGGGSTPGTNGSAAGNGLTGALVGAIGQGAVLLGGMLLNSFGSKSTARTQADANKQTASGIFSGMGQGASIGATFGHWGAAIGAAAGALVGSIGQKGKKASMTSFTDYDEGTLSTGLMGAFGGNNKLKRERRRIKSNAYSNRMAVEGTENLAYEFAEENTMGGVNSFKDGGMMGNKQLAFTDRGEVMLHPDGTVTQNPDAGTHGADQYLSALEPGTAVLGNKINPRTGNKFKEDGDAVTRKYKTRKSLQNIQFADSKMLNDRNMEAELQRLVAEQQSVLDKEGNKKKFKKLDGSKVMAAKDGIVIPAYEGGETKTNPEQISPEEMDAFLNFLKQTTLGKLTRKGVNWVWDLSVINPNGYGWDKVGDYWKLFKEYGKNQTQFRDRFGRLHVLNQNTDNSNSPNSQQAKSKLTQEQINETFGSRDNALGRYDLPIVGGYHSFDDHGLFNGYGPTFDASVEVPIELTQMPIVAANVKANTKPTITEEELAANKKAAERPEVKVLTEAQHNMILNGLQLGLKTPDLHIPTRINNEPLKKMNIASPQTEELEKAPKDYSWIGDLAGTIGQLAVAIPGLGAKPETAKFYRDPSWNASRNALLSTINNDEIINQALLEQGKQRSISNYNLARTSANTGRNLGAMTQTAVNSANAVVDARIRQKLANDQALQAYSDMMHAYGKEHQAEEVRVSEANAANRAAALMTNDAARKSIHNILAGSTKSYNTKLRDKQLLPLYRRFLEAGFTHEDLSPLYS